MRIQQIECWRYAVPLRRQFTTSSGVLRVRQGLIVRLTDADGVTGLGEAAPLASFGTGTVDDSEHIFASVASDVRGGTFSQVNGVIERLEHDPLAAPVRFALETAILDIEATRAGHSLARCLSPDTAQRVPVNATIGERKAARAVIAAREAVDQGYSAIKLKVGVVDDISLEVERIAAVRNAIGPRIELRLDANGAWDFERARKTCDALSGLEIAHIEQPLPALDIEGTSRLRQETAIPIALDESASSLDAIRDIIEQRAADVLIVKPGVIGGLRSAHLATQRALDAGLRVVVTTSLETGVGVAACLHLAATLPAPIPACGLGTLSLLEDDLLVDRLAVCRGQMKVPLLPGLGIALD